MGVYGCVFITGVEDITDWSVFSGATNIHVSCSKGIINKSNHTTMPIARLINSVMDCGAPLSQHAAARSHRSSDTTMPTIDNTDQLAVSKTKAPFKHTHLLFIDQTIRYRRVYQY